MSYRQVPTSSGESPGHRILQLTIEIEALKRERDALSREAAVMRPVFAAAIMFEECSDDEGSNRLINAVLAMKRTNGRGA